MLHRQIGPRRVRNFNATGHIVFPNDAEDIKAHPFFRTVQWQNLHLTRPPFVPRVHGGQPITKYFDDEAEIMSASDHLDSSSYDHTPAGDITPVIERKIGEGDGGADVLPQQEPAKGAKRVQRRKKEKKRPRDKLLRDPQVGRTVLELRKRGEQYQCLFTYVTYTYIVL